MAGRRNHAGTKALSTELVGNVGTIERHRCRRCNTSPRICANGASDLIEEVQNTKITGEEEAFSHIDLVDFAGNVEGAQQAYAVAAARAGEDRPPTWSTKSTSSSRRC